MARLTQADLQSLLGFLRTCETFSDVAAGNGDDFLLGGAGNGDTVAGERGDDALLGGPGTADACDGGPGEDTAETAGFEACEVVTEVP
jgi:hypothetical protein